MHIGAPDERPLARGTVRLRPGGCRGMECGDSVAALDRPRISQSGDAVAALHIPQACRGVIGRGRCPPYVLSTMRA